MSANAPTTSSTLHLVPHAVVLLRDDGLTIPSLPGPPTVALGLPELLVLAALSRRPTPPLDAVIGDVVGATGVAVESVERFVQRLRHRSLVTDDAEERLSAARPVGERRPAPCAPLSATTRIRARTPVVARVVGGRFEFFDHDGYLRAQLTPTELFALSSLVDATTVDEGYAAHRRAAGDLALERGTFGSLVEALLAAGLVDVVAEEAKERIDDLPGAVNTEYDAALLAVIRRRAREHEAAEREREARTGVTRTKVVPVALDPGPPLGLGLIISYAKAYKGGELQETYDFRTEWVWDEESLPSYVERPSVFLFSNYLWSHKFCMEICERVKQLSPACITICGGPDTPKYEADVEAYFAAHPWVDITVRGEGEAATAEVLDALRSVVGSEHPDLSVLADVPGISYREGDRVVRTANRERMADLNVVPSPFLTGLFDAYAEVPGARVTIETNRGCPYGCTFCDWGSSTLSRIRKFDLDRVFGELEWCAKNKAFSVGPADANFGIFERDVEIAERIAELKRQYGHPDVFGVSYAKNTVKHLRHIIQTMADAGIVSQGILSLQSMDQATLDAVHRSNIKTEKYDALAAEFRRADLPLFVDLMLGLPGSTPASFRADLQQCIDREVQVRIPRTTLLVNSPMNDPQYREHYQIETITSPGPGKVPFVVATSTFTREEYREMLRLRFAFLLFENFGVLRHTATFVRQETGLPEIEFYDGLRRRVEADPTSWPFLAIAVTAGPGMMCAPVSWRFFVDEVREYLLTEVGMQHDSALTTVLAVQHGLLPDHDRHLPCSLELPHDYAAWHASVLAAKESSDRSRWTEYVPRLREFPPAQFVIDDPGGVVRRSIGCDIEFHGFGLNWEYESPVRRAFRAKDRPPETLTAV